MGVPTVADRVAQMVVKQIIEPNLDSAFLTDSYGYRPRKSALDALPIGELLRHRSTPTLVTGVLGLAGVLPN